MPRRGHCGPWRSGLSMMTLSPSRLVISWITTVSAPAGTTPPVKMRAASPGSDLAVEGMAGGDLADHRQRRRRLRDIGGAHGIAVHGGDGGRRLRAQRRQILGQHAAERLVERRPLGRQRLGAREHARQGFGDRHQRHRLSPPLP